MNQQEYEKRVDEFVARYKGKTLGYPEGSYVGECLSLVKVFMKEVFGFNPPASGCNGARCYWEKFPDPLPQYFDKVVNGPTDVPKVGDIPVWNANAGGGFGHISIFLSGDVNAFTSFDQNWSGKQAHKQEHNYNNIFGWLRPKLTQESPPEPPESTKRAEYKAAYQIARPNADPSSNELDWRVEQNWHPVDVGRDVLKGDTRAREYWVTYWNIPTEKYIVKEVEKFIEPDFKNSLAKALYQLALRLDGKA